VTLGSQTFSFFSVLCPVHWEDLHSLEEFNKRPILYIPRIGQEIYQDIFVDDWDLQFIVLKGKNYP
jgi:hypothetical protein